MVGLNLAQKPPAEEEEIDSKDPMADIKKRELALKNERVARETALRREYEQRLEEFEADY